MKSWRCVEMYSAMQRRTTRADTGGRLPQSVFGDLDRINPKAFLADAVLHVMKANTEVPPPWIGLNKMDDKMRELFEFLDKDMDGLRGSKRLR